MKTDYIEEGITVSVVSEEEVERVYQACIVAGFYQTDRGKEEHFKNSIRHYMGHGKIVDFVNGRWVDDPTWEEVK